MKQFFFLMVNILLIKNQISAQDDHRSVNEIIINNTSEFSNKSSVLTLEKFDFEYKDY
jgi:hypothetical protein